MLRRVSWTWFFAGWLIGAPLLSYSGQPKPCPGGAAQVTGANAQDFADVCKGAANALAFFAGHGVLPTEPVSIEVTDQLPAEAGPSAVGCYIEQKRRAYLVPYNKFKKQKTWFGVRIDRSMYQALASHETAHAVAGCNFRIPNPTIQAKEYLAYVAMWSSMTPALRRKAARQMHTEGFDSLDRFTPMLYLFDPMRFGAEAYRHFQSEANPTALIQDVLNGRALTE